MKGYGDRARTDEEVSHLFSETYPNRPPIQRSTVSRTVKRFRESSSVKDLPRSRRPKSATNEELALEVLQCFVENPHTSIIKSAQYVGVSTGSIHKKRHENKYHPFKVQLHQELNGYDPDRRLQFCEIVRNKCIRDENFPKLVLFFDEASFCLNGTVNRYNSRYWSQENPQWMVEAHTQHPQKVNVWAG